MSDTLQLKKNFALFSIGVIEQHVNIPFLFCLFGDRSILFQTSVIQLNFRF